MPEESTTPVKQRRPVREPTLLVLAGSFAALEGYDLACYGTTVPSLLADKSWA